MTIKPERARGTFLGMVLAGAPLHPDAVRLSLRLTDERLASAFSLVAELELHRAGERFSIRRSGSETQGQASLGWVALLTGCISTWTLFRRPSS